MNLGDTKAGGDPGSSEAGNGSVSQQKVSKLRTFLRIVTLIRSLHSHTLLKTLATATFAGVCHHVSFPN